MPASASSRRRGSISPKRSTAIDSRGRCSSSVKAFSLRLTAAQPGTVAQDGKGCSIWARPTATKGSDALLRDDHLKPNDGVNSTERSRARVGVSYWFPHQGSVSSALMLDYVGQTFQILTP